MAGLERRVHAISPVLGSTCGTLRYAPSSISELQRSSDPSARLPPPNCGRAASGKRRLGGGADAPAPRLRTRPGHAAVPPPAAISRGYWYEQSSDRGGSQ